MKGVEYFRNIQDCYKCSRSAALTSIGTRLMNPCHPGSKHEELISLHPHIVIFINIKKSYQTTTKCNEIIIIIINVFW